MYCECNSFQGDLIFDKEDHGKQVNLKLADEFYIALPANPATGFTWAIAQIDSCRVKQVGEVSFKPDSEHLGAPGIQTFTFKCLQSADTVLEMIYRRPWETESAPIDTFSLTLIITD